MSVEGKVTESRDWGRSNSGKVQAQKRSFVRIIWDPRVSMISSEGAISTKLPVSFQTALQKTSRLSLTNLAALIYSRERTCRGMCWQTH